MIFLPLFPDILFDIDKSTVSVIIVSYISDLKKKLICLLFSAVLLKCFWMYSFPSFYCLEHVRFPESREPFLS